MIVSGLYIYPIKSMGGVALQQSVVTERGLAMDRRWMLADEHGRFMSQRQYPEMSQFQVSIAAGEGLVVTDRRSGASVFVPLTPQTADEKQVKIWDDTVQAVRVSDQADAWFSEALGQTCSLFYQPDSSVRPIDIDFSITGHEHVSFADGYPILLISQESLDELNSRSSQRMEMLRFRPNIVIEGATPHAEDRLKEMKVGSAVLYGVKPCSRCMMTTIDPFSSQKGKEPLQSLATYRRQGNKINFGQNVVVHQTGTIRLGDEIFT